MTSYEISYNGSVELQCQNGTYPECRDAYVHSLDNAVLKGHIEHEEAVRRLEQADALWDKYKKDPAVLEKMAMIQKEKDDHEAAILRAAGGVLSEARGEPVIVTASEKSSPKESTKEVMKPRVVKKHK